MGAQNADAINDILLRRAASLRPDRSRLSTRVAELIGRMILEEGLQPGDRLPGERQMLEQFAIGRASLREALRLLEADGLVRMRMGPNGGPEVVFPRIEQITRILLLFLITSGATLRDIYVVRAAIDPPVARLAAANAARDDVERLEETIARISSAVNQEEDFLRENANFHRLVAEICVNPMLTAVSLSMHSILDGHQAGIRYSVAARRAALESHRAKAEGIIAGDGDAASSAAASQVAATLSYFEKRYPKSLDQPLQPLAFMGYPAG